MAVSMLIAAGFIYLIANLKQPAPANESAAAHRSHGAAENGGLKEGAAKTGISGAPGETDLKGKTSGAEVSGAAEKESVPGEAGFEEGTCSLDPTGLPPAEDGCAQK